MLCRRFGISRKTGYKWLARYGAGGASALSDRSRRPHVSPARTSCRVSSMPPGRSTRFPSFASSQWPGVSAVASELGRVSCMFNHPTLDQPLFNHQLYFRALRQKSRFEKPLNRAAPVRKRAVSQRHRSRFADENRSLTVAARFVMTLLVDPLGAFWHVGSQGFAAAARDCARWVADFVDKQGGYRSPAGGTTHETWLFIS